MWFIYKGATTMFGFSNFYSGIAEENGIFLTAITIFLQITSICFLGCNFLIMHLSYYIIGYYIRLLGFSLLKEVKEKKNIAWQSTNLK